MKKNDYEKLLNAEKEFVPEHYITLYSFWVDKMTHYHIVHCHEDYIILRGWITRTGDPAVSVDIIKGNFVDIVSYVVSRFAPQTKHAPVIEKEEK